MDNKEEMPLGFSFSLAMDEKAMDRFAGMSEAEKNRVISQARSVQSKAEMEQLVAGIGKGTDRGMTAR